MPPTGIRIRSRTDFSLISVHACVHITPSLTRMTPARRLSERRLRLLQIRRLRSANSRFPCVALVMLSCMYTRHCFSWSAMEGADVHIMIEDPASLFARNDYEGQYLTCGRCVVLCVVQEACTRALSDAHGSWMEKVRMEHLSSTIRLLHRLHLTDIDYRSGTLCYLPDASRSCCPHYTIRLVDLIDPSALI